MKVRNQKSEVRSRITAIGKRLDEQSTSGLRLGYEKAYKNKQADAFKALLSKDYCGVYADGVKTLDVEVAGMAKTDLRDYSFADVKVMFPHPKVAVITYKAMQHTTSAGQDVSGTYNSGSVWIKEGGKWIGVFHTETKAQ